MYSNTNPKKRTITTSWMTELERFHMIQDGMTKLVKSHTAEMVTEQFSMRERTVIHSIVEWCKAHWETLSREEVEFLMTYTAFEISHQCIRDYTYTKAQIVARYGIKLEEDYLPVSSARALLLQNRLLNVMGGIHQGNEINFQAYSLQQQMDGLINTLVDLVGEQRIIKGLAFFDWDDTQSTIDFFDKRAKPNLMTHEAWAKYFHVLRAQGMYPIMLTSRSRVCGERDIRSILGSKEEHTGLNAALVGELFSGGILYKGDVVHYLMTKLSARKITVVGAIVFEDQDLELEIIHERAKEENLAMCGVQSTLGKACESYQLALETHDCLYSLNSLISETLVEATTRETAEIVTKIEIVRLKPAVTKPTREMGSEKTQEHDSLPIKAAEPSRRGNEPGKRWNWQLPKILSKNLGQKTVSVASSSMPLPKTPKN